MAEAKPFFGGKFSYSDRVSLYLEGLLSAVEQEAEAAARRKLRESEEFKAILQKEVQIALERLSVHLRPRLIVSGEPEGMQIVISAWNRHGEDDPEWIVPLAKLLHAAEDEDEESYDAYIEDMARFVEARKRKLKHRNQRTHQE